MPLTLSAIKQSRQNAVRRERLRPYDTRMKTMIRKVSDLVKDGKLTDAATLLPTVYKAIDTAAKKGILHPKTAARRKSKMARMVGKKA